MVDVALFNEPVEYQILVLIAFLVVVGYSGVGLWLIWKNDKSSKEN